MSTESGRERVFEMMNEAMLEMDQLCTIRHGHRFNASNMASMRQSDVIKLICDGINMRYAKNVKKPYSD